MGKKDSPVKDRQRVPPETALPPDTPSEPGDGPGAGGGSDSSQQCWEFPLARRTPLAAGVEVGHPVEGSATQQRILVAGQPGLLGQVPSTEAGQIRLALSESTSGALQGEVTRQGAENTWVVICLEQT